MPYFVTWSMVEEERKSPALRDGHPRAGPRPLLRAALVLALGFGICGSAWLGWQQLRRGACDQRSQTDYQVASYDDRLALRAISRAVEDAEGDKRDWGELRPRLDNHQREWVALRTRACMERDTALARCLDEQARALASRVDAWVDRDPSSATSELDDAITAPTRCLEEPP